MLVRVSFCPCDLSFGAVAPFPPKTEEGTRLLCISSRSELFFQLRPVSCVCGCDYSWSRAGRCFFPVGNYQPVLLRPERERTGCCCLRVSFWFLLSWAVRRGSASCLTSSGFGIWVYSARVFSRVHGKSDRILW